MVTVRRLYGQVYDAVNINEKAMFWKKMINELAEYSNLYIKLGGIGMDMQGAGWNKPTKPDSIELAAIMEQWFAYCIDKFGAERCMFESNFPVDKRSFSYNVY